MRITGLGHAGIGVRNLDASRHFYTEVLGMPVVANGSRELRLQVSEAEQLVLSEVADGSRTQPIAFIVGNTPRRLDEAAAHLEAHRVDYERIVREEHESLLCRDPDGRTVELYYWPSW